MEPRRIRIGTMLLTEKTTKMLIEEIRFYNGSDANYIIHGLLPQLYVERVSPLSHDDLFSRPKQDRILMSDFGYKCAVKIRDSYYYLTPDEHGSIGEELVQNNNKGLIEMERGSNYVTTYSGVHFYPLDIREEDVIVHDIAHTLANTSRYKFDETKFSHGHHSVLAAKEALARGLDRRIQLACLLWDAADAYLQAIKKPVKAIAPDYEVIEKRLQGVILRNYGVDDLTPEEKLVIYDIQTSLLFYEGKVLFGDNFPYSEKFKTAQEYHITEMHPSVVENQFLEWLCGLTIQLNK
jgi:uncharacterized protein